MEKMNVFMRFMVVLLACILTLKLCVGSLYTGSTLTIYEGPGCTNEKNIYLSCDMCVAVFENGGYDFRYSSLTASLYTSDDCEGEAAGRLDYSNMECNGLQWRSIRLDCS